MPVMVASIDIGLIPAHAGKTAVVPRRRGFSTAHPRSRGENRRARSSVIAPPGSSPLTRGKPTHGRRRTRSRTAHPRSRGENPSFYRRIMRFLGSSPLTRGKPHGRDHPDSSGRLIPAHAGKTAGTQRRTSRPLAHPRSRGENALLGAAVGIGGGSSPLTRGKLHTTIIACTSQRLIPAHAGKTAPCGVCELNRGAHPRSRGENLFQQATTMVAQAHPRSRGEN